MGRHLVEEALEGGHGITLFNRGQTSPGLFPELEHLTGDRDGDLSVLKGRSWDAVIDTYGYIPRIVRKSTKLLSSSAGYYAFISTLSVYADESTPGQDETAPLATLSDPSTEEVNDQTYGPLKVLCEREVERGFPGRSLMVRAGLIVGPHDYTDRFTYWVRRVARGGEVLVPEPRDSPVQFIDVRDLAEWVVRMLERRVSGAVNATGPAQCLSMQELLDE